MKSKALVISLVLNIILISVIVGILNTTYEIEVNGITYKQRIYDYLRGAE